MPNHAAHYVWRPYHHDVLRPSVLGRAAGRKAVDSQRRPASYEDTEEATQSRETNARLHAAVHSLRAGNIGEQAASIAKAIRSWRADNAAGGLGVLEHLPLPTDLASALARHFDEMDDVERKPAFDGVIRELDPSVRTQVAQQVAAWMGNSSASDGGSSDLDRSWLELPANSLPWVGDKTASERSSASSEVKSRDRFSTAFQREGAIDDGWEDHREIAGRLARHAYAVRDGRANAVVDGADDEEEGRGEPELRTLELRPEEQDVKAVPLRFVDDEGNVVYEAWELPDGSIAPPRPSHNKVLPIDSSIPQRQRPPGYSDGGYSPDAKVGLRREYDKKLRREVFKPHHGIDFRASYGQPVRVAADGVVVAVQDAGGYGSLIAVRHPDGTMTMYAHLVPGKVFVKPGQYIRVGTIIGQAGTSGNAGRPQVHFEVWDQAYLLPGGGLDFNRGKQNTIDPYKWYARPMMPGWTPRPKPPYR